MPATHLSRILLCTLTATLLTSGTITAQPPADLPVLPGADQAGDPQRWARLPGALTAARDAIKDRQWDAAAHVLQALLDTPPAVLVPQKEPGDGKATHWHSPHAQANALLAALPDAGLTAYRKHYGPQAAALLKQAQQKPDAALLTQLVQRYRHTDAGREALAALAEQHTQAGRHVEAALAYDLLLQRPAAAKALPKLLHQTAAAYRRAGDKANADRLVKRLQAALAKDPVTLKEIEADLERIKIAAADDWPLFRGNAARNRLAPAGAVKVKAEQWARPTVMDKYRDLEIDPGPEAKDWLDRMLKQILQKRAPLAPGGHPIVVGQRAVYRSHFAAAAVAFQEMRQSGEVVKTGEIYWKTTAMHGSLGSLLDRDFNRNGRSSVEVWLREYEKTGGHAAVLENGLVGSLSGTGKWVLLVDDLSVPPAPRFFQKQKGQGVAFTFLQPRIEQNTLLGYSLDTGKLHWGLGNLHGRKDLFDKSHWLGAPLPLGESLYALNETNDGELRLVCLEAATGKAQWMQTLATVKEKFLHDPNRRTQACHLAYADGVLLCPTNAGTLLAFDLATRTTRWAYTYRPVRETDVTKVQLSPPAWRASAPILHDGQVIYAGPDDDAVYCLDLRDGALRWQAKRDGEHYVAGVVGDRVVLVGQDHCRALRLKDGGQLWKAQVDEVTGLGVLGADGLLQLPVRGQAMGLWTVDTAKGQVVARQALPGLELPGNLVRHAGGLLSQSATRISSLAK